MTLYILISIIFNNILNSERCEISKMGNKNTLKTGYKVIKVDEDTYWKLSEYRVNNRIQSLGDTVKDLLEKTPNQKRKKTDQ